MFGDGLSVDGEGKVPVQTVLPNAALHLRDTGTLVLFLRPTVAGGTWMHTLPGVVAVRVPVGAAGGFAGPGSGAVAAAGAVVVPGTWIASGRRRWRGPGGECGVGAGAGGRGVQPDWCRRRGCRRWCRSAGSSVAGAGVVDRHLVALM